MIIKSQKEMLEIKITHNITLAYVKQNLIVLKRKIDKSIIKLVDFNTSLSKIVITARRKSVRIEKDSPAYSTKVI